MSPPSSTRAGEGTPASANVIRQITPLDLDHPLSGPAWMNQRDPCMAVLLDRSVPARLRQTRHRLAVPPPSLGEWRCLGARRLCCRQSPGKFQFSRTHNFPSLSVR